MLITIQNLTENQVFLDLFGVNDVKDIITIPGKSKIETELPTEKAFINLSKKLQKDYKNILVIKKY